MPVIFLIKEDFFWEEYCSYPIFIANLIVTGGECHYNSPKQF